LYETFPVEEAFSIVPKQKIYYTPKQGRRLNIAEIELSAMTRQCLNRRIDSPERLKGELAAWQLDREAKDSKMRLFQNFSFWNSFSPI
jgi:hypothetical protein